MDARIIILGIGLIAVIVAWTLAKRRRERIPTNNPKAGARMSLMFKNQGALHTAKQDFWKERTGTIGFISACLLLVYLFLELGS